MRSTASSAGSAARFAPSSTLSAMPSRAAGRRRSSTPRRRPSRTDGPPASRASAPCTGARSRRRSGMRSHRSMTIRPVERRQPRPPQSGRTRSRRGRAAARRSADRIRRRRRAFVLARLSLQATPASAARAAAPGVRAGDIPPIGHPVTRASASIPRVFAGTVVVKAPRRQPAAAQGLGGWWIHRGVGPQASASSVDAGLARRRAAAST